MEHGPEEHLEHAEHAQHAARNPFDRRVTVTIAIVAAVLAGVTMAAHRAHNDTLILQGEATKEKAQLGIQQTEIANQYAFYQAKNNRGVLFEAFLDMIAMLPLKEGTEKVHEKATAKWKKQLDKYEVELPKMLEEAERLKLQAKDHEHKAAVFAEQSHDAHARAGRFDLGELGLQLGVVLCSLAILRKSRGFWYGGIAISVLGLIVALSGAFGVWMGEGGH